MLQKSRNLLIFLTICTLVGLSYGLIGQHVRAIRTTAYSFVVSISRRSANLISTPLRRHFCTGTLVTQRSVVTAAHCLNDKKRDEIEVVAGSPTLSRGYNYEIQSWTSFEQWNQNRSTPHRHNDVAVLILARLGVIDIHPVVVSTVPSVHLEHQEVNLLGWGNLENGRQALLLRLGHLNVTTNQECSNQGTMLKGSRFTVPENYFCSKASPFVVSTCGDGGGPILNANRRLVGINIGVCPRVEGYPQDMLNQLQLNAHLNLYYYKHFLDEVVV